MEKKTVDKIIHVAFKSFLEKGYEATNVRDICKEVGIKASSLYFYYKSKEDLFLFIYDEIITDYLKYLQSIEELNGDILVEEKLFILLKYKMKFYAADISKIKFILRYHLFPSEEISNSIRERYKLLSIHENKLILDAVRSSKNKDLLNKETIDSYLTVYKRLDDYLGYQMTFLNIMVADKTISKLWATFKDSLAT